MDEKTKALPFAEFHLPKALELLPLHSGPRLQQTFLPRPLDQALQDRCSLLLTRTHPGRGLAIEEFILSLFLSHEFILPFYLLAISRFYFFDGSFKAYLFQSSII